MYKKIDAVKNTFTAPTQSLRIYLKLIKLKTNDILDNLQILWAFNFCVFNYSQVSNLLMLVLKTAFYQKGKNYEWTSVRSH